MFVSVRDALLADGINVHNKWKYILHSINILYVADMALNPNQLLQLVYHLPTLHCRLLSLKKRKTLWLLQITLG